MIIDSTSSSLGRRDFLARTTGGVAAAALASAVTLPRLVAAAAPTTPSTRTLFRESARPMPVLGIAEWFCYYTNFDVSPPEDAIEQCIDLHQAFGMDHLVWSVGRAVVEYHSKNPRNTLMGDLGADSAGPEDWSGIIRLLRKECQVRRAIRVAHQRGLKIWGRLGMNRHYGAEGWLRSTSRFSQENPQFKEHSRLGKIDNTRLCYAFDEVQAERSDIILEVQQLGLDGLVLDYCRQPPITRYHPRWGKLFTEAGGRDPSMLTTATIDQMRPWFQFRADVVTQFMRGIRKRVRAEEEKTGKKCPLIARVSATSLFANVAAGLDVATWLRDDLIDAVMLSPLVFCADALDFKFEDYAGLAHRFGKACIGGLGSLDLIRNHVPNNTGFFRPEPIYRLLASQYDAGVDAMSVYQTESLLRMDYLREHMALIGNESAVRARATRRKGDGGESLVGKDWHSWREGKFTGYTLAGKAMASSL